MPPTISLNLNEAGYVVGQSHAKINRAVDRGVIKAALSPEAKRGSAGSAAPSYAFSRSTPRSTPSQAAPLPSRSFKQMLCDLADAGVWDLDNGPPPAARTPLLDLPPRRERAARTPPRRQCDRSGVVRDRPD